MKYFLLFTDSRGMQLWEGPFPDKGEAERRRTLLRHLDVDPEQAFILPAP